jgi:hypothetical protein
MGSVRAQPEGLLTLYGYPRTLPNETRTETTSSSDGSRVTPRPLAASLLTAELGGPHSTVAVGIGPLTTSRPEQCQALVPPATE